MAQIRLLGGPFRDCIADHEGDPLAPAVLAFDREGRAEFSSRHGRQRKVASWQVRGLDEPLETDGRSHVVAVYRNADRAGADGLAEYEYSHENRFGISDGT